MSGWVLSKFKDHFSIGLRNGLNKPSRVRGSGVRMVNMKEIFGYDFIDDKTPMELVPVTDKEFESSNLEYGDLLFARQSLTEAGAGKVALYRGSQPTVFESHLIRCRINKQKSDPTFLYYLFKSPLGKGAVSTIVHQVAAAGIKGSDLQELEFLFPTTEEQKAIASILSSLDDKIDLLHRQNTTLERMAETLFRQWFVEEMREDWEEVTLEDVSIRITDGSHTSPPNVEFGLPMASVKDMYQWGIDISTCRQISKDDFDELVRTDCRPLKNDILIAKDGSYLKHVFVAENDLDVVILSSIAIIRPNNKYHPLLLATFLKLDSTRVAMENIVTGAVIPRIVLKDFRKFPIVLPPIELQDKAVKVIAPMYAKCWENNRQIQTLEKLRDNLLPKLMSGEIRLLND